MYDTILVPTDRSDVAVTAGTAAIELADRFDATLRIVHVLDPEERPRAFEGESVDELARRGEQAVRAIADLAADAGVESTTAVVEAAGPVHRTIVDEAESNDVDLVAMGTHGRTGLDRYVLGSVAERTLRTSPVPVLTVHGGSAVDLDVGDVLVPTDGSACSDAAAEHAAAFAAATGARVHAINTVDTAVGWSDPGSSTVLDALEEAGRAALEDVVARAEAAGVDRVETSIRRDRPHRAVLDYVDEHDVDLVVMGTHGRTGLNRYLLGSVTERVVRLSDVPVIGVKAADATE